MEMQTVKDLKDEMYSHKDVGVGMQVRSAIDLALDQKLIREDDPLTPECLGKIRQKIYEQNRNPDPMAYVFQALVGKTLNPVEAALQYIEGRMRLIR